MGQGRNAFKILTGKPTGKVLKRIRENTVRINHSKIGVNVRSYIDWFDVKLISELLLLQQ